MHWPSKKMLESEIHVDGIKNCYGKEFFKDFKYVSDSRMFWREDVMKIIKKQEEKRLHILTHPFWYFEEEKATEDILFDFIEAAGKERYYELNDNFRNLDEYLDIRKNEVLKKTAIEKRCQ